MTASYLEARRANRREELLKAAVSVFSEKGYRASSMQDLATKAECSKAALYYYISSKEEILVALYESVIKEGVESARRIADSQLPALDAIREIIVERVAYTCRNRKIMQIFFEEEAELPQALLSTVRRQQRKYENTIAEVFERGLRDGTFATDVRPRIVVNTVLGAAHWVYRWYNPRGGRSPEELGLDIAALLIGGLQKGGG